MTMTGHAPQDRPLTVPSAASGWAPLTLADEHALLLGQVAARAEDLIIAADERRWPARELKALLGYVRAEVLRHVADEEAQLFPAAGTSPDVARLARDHVRLRAGAEMLALAATREEAMAPTRLAAAAQDFTCQLERHMSAEEALLTSADPPGMAAATTALASHPHEWYPLTEGPVIDLDALPPSQAIDAAAARLLRLHPGEQVELRSGSDLDPVWRAVDRFSPGALGFACLQEGPGRWRMRVTRRPVAA